MNISWQALWKIKRQMKYTYYQMLGSCNLIISHTRTHTYNTEDNCKTKIVQDRRQYKHGHVTYLGYRPSVCLSHYVRTPWADMLSCQRQRRNKKRVWEQKRRRSGKRWGTPGGNAGGHQIASRISVPQDKRSLFLVISNCWRVSGEQSCSGRNLKENCEHQADWLRLRDNLTHPWKHCDTVALQGTAWVQILGLPLRPA